MLTDIFSKPNDVFHLAEEGVEFTGTLETGDLTRLAGKSGDMVNIIQKQPLSMQLSAGHRSGVGPYIELSIHGEVSLVCQRCMQTMAYAIRIERLFGLVRNEYFAQRLPAEYEPLLLPESEAPLSIMHLIEDEILLACPVIPRHEEESCNPLLTGLRSHDAADEAGETSRHHPFADLHQRIRQKH